MYILLTYMRSVVIKQYGNTEAEVISKRLIKGKNNI